MQKHQRIECGIQGKGGIGRYWIIPELPSEWSMTYDPEDGYTTTIMKGKAKVCPGGFFD